MITYDEHLSSDQIEQLKTITKKFRKELTQINLIDQFKLKMKDIDKLRKNSENDLENYYWNKALEDIQVELFPLYLSKFELTPRQQFMYYTFKKCKPYFLLKEDNFYLHRYILSGGRGGINSLNVDAFEFNRLQINLGKPYDLIVLLYYLKGFYKINDLILENLSIFLYLLQEELNNSRIDNSLDIIHHYYLERNDAWNIPKLKYYQRSKKFFYIYIRDCLIQCLRRSENLLRTRLGFKKIGEGYLREKLLYNELIKLTDPKKIKKHYRPDWLYGLELDFYFKIGNVEFAVEHQGEQHVRAINFFGGHLSFNSQIQRDRMKLDICIERKIKLRYCYYDDDLQDFINKIREDFNLIYG